MRSSRDHAFESQLPQRTQYDERTVSSFQGSELLGKVSSPSWDVKGRFHASIEFGQSHCRGSSAPDPLLLCSEHFFDSPFKLAGVLVRSAKRADQESRTHVRRIACKPPVEHGVSVEEPPPTVFFTDDAVVGETRDCMGRRILADIGSIGESSYRYVQQIAASEERKQHPVSGQAHTPAARLVIASIALDEREILPADLKPAVTIFVDEIDVLLDEPA